MASQEVSLSDDPLTSGIQDDFISRIEPSVVRYLGPQDSYSEIMATVMLGTDFEVPQRRGGWRAPHYIPHENFSQVTEAVYHDQGNSLTVGILPVENSQTSTIQTVTDALLTGDYYILGEGSLLVEIQLAGNGKTIDEVKTVYSQSKPFGQARRFLTDHRFRQEEVDSTSRAAQLVSSMGATAAALCSRHAAKHYGLTVLAENVHDDPHNQTRFLIVQSREGRHRPDGDLLPRGGQLGDDELAKVAGIVSPKKPAMDDGYQKAMEHMRDMKVHSVQMGRRNSQREQVGGDGDYLVEFTGPPRILFDVFNNDSSYKSFMAFRLLGVYATGSLYKE
ncbi:MAG TPA: prephenate dehydratase domain-containing protein [Candidatus Saccharimonadales bacterium]|nr:prephenate dehydratase domain-containing protein [Candidatus Saccharimonadales bacterium]